MSLAEINEEIKNITEKVTVSPAEIERLAVLRHEALTQAKVEVRDPLIIDAYTILSLQAIQDAMIVRHTDEYGQCPCFERQPHTQHRWMAVRLPMVIATCPGIHKP